MALIRRRVLVVAGALVVIAALLALRAAVTRRAEDRLARDGTVRTGSWWFPRGGPYILGFDSPSNVATLSIDGRVVVRGGGEKTARVIYDRGVHAVTFDGPDDARLLWHPPGRRGAPEYVPASSLSPEPAASARFGGGAGASRFDALIATLILLTVIAAAVAFSLDQRPVDLQVLLLAGAVAAAALLVRLYGLNAAGQTWDEDEYWSSGRNYVVNVLSLDFRPSSWRWNFQHPPVTKLIAGVGALWSDGYGVARAFMAILSAATCGLLVLVGRRAFSLYVGVAAGVFAALLPHLIGHARIVGHETPSVFFWTLAIHLALRVREDGKAQPGRFVGVGIVLGLAVATRFTNLLLLPVAALAMLVTIPDNTRSSWMARARIAIYGVIITIPTTIAAFLAVWPRMWASPLARLDQSWDVLKQPHAPEYYLGSLVVAPPWHYFPVYLVATTPLLVLVAALAGVVRAVGGRERIWLLVAAWIVVPFAVIWSPVRQDGLRYVLPSLPAVALLAAAGLGLITTRLARSKRADLAHLAVGVYLLFTLIRVHPYYLDYYAEQVGGTERVRARRWFEVGWWGEGIGEAVGYVNRHAAPGAKLWKDVEPIHVNWLRIDLWNNLVSSPQQAEWILVNEAALRLRKTSIPEDAELVHAVTAQGATIAAVYHREPKAQPPASEP